MAAAPVLGSMSAFAPKADTLIETNFSDSKENYSKPTTVTHSPKKFYSLYFQSTTDFSHQ